MTAPAQIRAAAVVLRKEHRVHSTRANKRRLAAFAAAVLSLRKKRKLTREVFARKLRISYHATAHIELGHNFPTVPVYLAICRVLKVGVPPLLK